MQNPSELKKNENTKLTLMMTQNVFVDEVRQCRICLEEQSEDNRLLQPCHCAGTLSYVHDKCMREWIKKKKLKKPGQIQCQLCKKPITFTTQTKTMCVNCEQFSEYVSDEPKLFYFLVIVTIINFGFIGLLIFLAVDNTEPDSADQVNVIKVAVLCSAIAALLIVIAISLYVLLKQYAIVRISEVVKINQVRRAQVSEVTNQGSKGASANNSRHSNKVYPQIQIIQFE